MKLPLANEIKYEVTIPMGEISLLGKIKWAKHKHTHTQRSFFFLSLIRMPIITD